MNCPATSPSHITQLWLSRRNNHGHDLTFEPQTKTGAALCFFSHFLTFSPRREQFWVLNEKPRMFSRFNPLRRPQTMQNTGMTRVFQTTWSTFGATASRGNGCKPWPLVSSADPPSHSAKWAFQLGHNAAAAQTADTHIITSNRALCLSPFNTKWHMVPFSCSTNIPSTYTVIVHAQAMCLWLSSHIWQPAIKTWVSAGPPHQPRAVSLREPRPTSAIKVTRTSSASRKPQN